MAQIYSLILPLLHNFHAISLFLFRSLFGPFRRLGGGDFASAKMPPPPTFQLLEINIISAQDLAHVAKAMRTYAVAWVHPERKLATRIDETGRANPTWNDKFVFRVDDQFLNSDTAAIMIEIFASNWLRDVLIGTVRILIGNLFPNSVMMNTNPGMRFVALQIRRPSGRPQGILNMGVSLLNGAMRSMPLYKDLSSSTVGFHNLMDDHDRQSKDDHDLNRTALLKTKFRRTQSERSDPTCYGGGGSTICNGSVVTGSEVGVPLKGSLVSDVGPSASVVAAAIAKGIYPIGMPVPPAVAPEGGGSEVGSSILEDWTEESVEGLKTKIGRWKAELPPIYDYGSSEHTKKTPGHGRRHARRRTEGGGEGGGKLFSCFGNAYGCEFTIVCGANNSSQKKRGAGGKVHVSPSDNNNDISH